MQDAIIARFHYFQSTMLPASMQLNESVLTFSTPKAEKDLVIVRPRQLKSHAHSSQFRPRHRDSLTNDDGH